MPASTPTDDAHTANSALLTGHHQAAYRGSQSESITYPMALITSRRAVSSSTPTGPDVRSSCVFSTERMFSHCATQSEVNPNFPDWNGTQLGSVRRRLNRADVQTTTKA